MSELNNNVKLNMNLDMDARKGSAAVAKSSPENVSIFSGKSSTEADNMQEVFENSVVDIVDHHSGSYGAIKQAYSDKILDKDKPIKILHFDTHSDLYTENSNVVNIGNYLNYVASEENVSDIYWVIPEEAKKNVLDAQGCDDLVSVVCAQPAQKIYINKNEKLESKDKLSFEEPSDFVKAPSKYKVVNLHTLTKDNLPSFEGESNIVLDFDNDYLQNSGRGTYKNLKFIKGKSGIEASSSNAIDVLNQKGVKPNLTIFARSQNFSLPEDSKGAEESYLAFEKFNYNAVKHSKDKTDYLSENSYDVHSFDVQEPFSSVKTKDSEYYQVADAIKQYMAEEDKLVSEFALSQEEQLKIADKLSNDLKMPKVEAYQKIETYKKENFQHFVKDNSREFNNLNDSLYLNNSKRLEILNANILSFADDDASKYGDGQKVLEQNKVHLQEYQEALNKYFTDLKSNNSSSQSDLHVADVRKSLDYKLQNVNAQTSVSVDDILEKLRRLQESQYQLKVLKHQEFDDLFSDAPTGDDILEQDFIYLKKIKNLTDLSNTQELKLLSKESNIYFNKGN